MKPAPIVCHARSALIRPNLPTRVGLAVALDAQGKAAETVSACEEAFRLPPKLRAKADKVRAGGA